MWLIAAALTPASASERRAVELTFLKANAGQREQLKVFIVANWFAMDRIAQQQGLMKSYTLFDTGTDDGAWNVLVAVTYMDSKGYDGVAVAFEKIRKAHKTVGIEGKTFRELGTIVESKRVFENIPKRLSLLPRLSRGDCQAVALAPG